MRKKRDMFIDYRRTYKRHRRRKNTVSIILVALLALGLGIAAYFGVKSNMASDHDRSAEADRGDTSKSDITLAAADPTVVPTKASQSDPTQKPTPSLAAATSVPEEDTRIPVTVKGIYVTAPRAGSTLMNDLISLVDTTEINAMVIDVKDDHGKISYAMDSPTAKEIGAVTNIIPDMKSLVDTLKSKNIYLIARIVAFKDPYLAEKRQDLAVRNHDGSIFRDNNGEGWVNPYNRKVWDYLGEIAAQAAAVGFEEIQFDYIRFSTGTGISEADFGEESKTVSKEEIITEFTKYIYEKLRPLGVFVSADVYGTIISSKIDAELVGQNYPEMAKYLDYICPMIYPSHFGEGNYGIKYPDQEPYNIIRKVLTASADRLSQIPESEHRAIVRPWLQAFTATWIPHHMVYGSTEIWDQIKGVYSTGYDEWILWNAACEYTKGGLNKE